MNPPKYQPGQRVIVNQLGQPKLVGQIGTVHICDPTYDIIAPGFSRYIGWWYHVVFDDITVEIPGFAWMCGENTLDPLDDHGDWNAIEKLIGWNPTKEKVH